MGSSNAERQAKTRNDTEKVSICYLTKRYHHALSVKNMLQQLKLPLLWERRKQARLTNLYKVAIKGLKIDAGDKLIPPDRLSR